MKNCCVLGFSFFLLLSVQVWAQQIYPQTMTIQVTYYDFHSNGSNPEFEKDPGAGGTHLGMVANTLNAQNKPQIGPTPYWSCRIDKWFTDWVPGDFTIPNYTSPATTTCGNPPLTVSYDTAFKNIKFNDSLVFTLVPGSAGTYQYYNPAFFPLDGKGFLNEGQAHNYSFSMELHKDFTKKTGLMFQFEGDDDVWAFINNKLVMDIGGIHNTTAGSLNVDTLGLTNDLSYKFDFFYCERHRTGSDIRITTNLLSPPPAKITFLKLPNVDTIKTADSIGYIASVLDNSGANRKDLSKLITWSVAPFVPGSLLAAFSPVTKLSKLTAGDTNTLYGGQAYRSYLLTATLVDPNNPTNIIHAYDTIYVKPAVDYRVVIEADTIIDTFAPARLGSISIDGNTNDAIAYGIVRDKFGQYTRLATNGVWSNRNTTLDTISLVAPKYIGKIHRIPLQNGIDTISAVETFPKALLPDSVQLVLQNGTVDSIRLVNSVTGEVITGITMNTDSSLSVKIQVVWSNDASKSWVDGTGSWALTPDTIRWDANPPGQGGSWNLSPKNPGVENLTITSGTKSKVVPVIITVAPPSKVTINVVNPPDSIIAGKPIKVAVKIENTDGLVPGSWCSTSATYTDALAPGANKPQPTILINGMLTPVALGQASQECFLNGWDTITITLYNAPASLDSAHKISLALFNTLKNISASTDPFHLNPGPLAALDLADANRLPLSNPDTLKSPDGAVTIYAWGYDQWQNLIGKIHSSWSETGSLHPLAQPTTNREYVYIDASSVILNENGVVTASAPSGAVPGTMVSDSLQLAILAGNATFADAVTKDINGNGYLDQIWIKFNKPISALANSNIAANNISVKYTAPGSATINTLQVESMKPVNVLNDTTSSFIIFLRDTFNVQDGILEPSDAVPQTAWLPLVSVPDLVGANSFTNKQCRDGAAPVIWRVTVNKVDVTNRSKDIVTITFSEPIASNTGSDFSISLLPNLVFNTWKKIQTASSKITFIKDVITLSCNKDSCITGFFKKPGDPLNPTTVQFTMLNNRTVFDYTYFNISTPSLIGDKLTGIGNAPDSLNQKVKPVIYAPVGPLTVGPNPAKPVIFKPAGNSNYSVLDFVNDPQATHYAKDIGGTVFQFVLTPSEGRITGYLNIYDVVGNLVNSAHRDGAGVNLLKDIPSGVTADTAGHYYYNIYWNCLNAQGMKVAPGVYHAFLYETIYGDNSTTSTRQQAIVGINR